DDFGKRRAAISSALPARARNELSSRLSAGQFRFVQTDKCQRGLSSPQKRAGGRHSCFGGLSNAGSSTGKPAQILSALFRPHEPRRRLSPRSPSEREKRHRRPAVSRTRSRIVGCTTAAAHVVV